MSDHKTSSFIVNNMVNTYNKCLAEWVYNKSQMFSAITDEERKEYEGKLEKSKTKTQRQAREITHVEGLKTTRDNFGFIEKVTMKVEGGVMTIDYTGENLDE